MNYEERIKWLRVENYVLVFWADAMVKREKSGEEVSRARITWFRDPQAMPKERLAELERIHKGAESWERGCEAACREIRALRLGDMSTLRAAALKPPRMGARR